jgi:uncharacterized membrane protein YfcA
LALTLNEHDTLGNAGGLMAEGWLIVWVLAVIFVATVIRSAFGFGEALVAVPLLALLLRRESGSGGRQSSRSRRTAWRGGRRWNCTTTAWLLGFGAGVLGGAYGMNGPPLVVYGSSSDSCTSLILIGIALLIQALTYR